MLRLRFFRILLPVLLLVLGVVLWKSWEPRSAVHSSPGDPASAGTPRAEGLSFKEFEGSSGSIAGDADLFEPGEDGSLHLEGIRNLEIERKDRGPLIVSANRGDRQGEEGAQVWQFDEQVVFREAESGLRLSLPSLQIDQASGEARSEGDIQFEAPQLRGRAESLMYGLKGQPGEMTRPELEEIGSGRLTADRARLLDGIRDIELLGDVRAVQGGQRLEAGSMRLTRSAQQGLRRATAGGGVSGSWPTVSGNPATLRSETLDVHWDNRRRIDSVLITGNALLSRETETLTATTVEATRRDDGEVAWQVHAAESVYLQGLFGAAPGLLRAEDIRADLDGAWTVRWAEAQGRVSFEGRGTRAEARRATFQASALPHVGDVELFGDDRRKARLAHARTRVAALSITTDTRGKDLRADGRVEATLLPDRRSPEDAPNKHLFVASEAIHFVSDRLESEDAGAHLVFTGSVRGWQGERNLAAKRIAVDQRNNTLEAVDNVSTRVPREVAQGTAGEADYIQIVADRLSYDEAEGQAVYVGSVRVRLVEGWMEAERVEVELSSVSQRIQEVRAFESVRLEFHRTSEDEMQRPLAGSADRLTYSPMQATLLLFGDRAPASVRRIGQGGGSTTGRVLRYRLDTGTLDVESGEQGPGRIVTADE